MGPGDILSSGSSSHTVNYCPFCSIFSGRCFNFLYFFVGDFTVLNSPKQGVEVLSNVPEHRGLGCALWRKHTLDKLPSGMSYTDLGHELNVHEPTIQIIQGVLKHKSR